jgi:hypothetical protein
METKFTEQQSLAVINEMIDRARNNIKQDSANNMVYNGYAVALVAVVNFILLHLLPEAETNMSFMVWWLMIPSACIDYFIKRKIDRSAIVKTQIDGVISQLWRGFSISIILLLIMIFSASFAFNKWTYALFITPSIMIMVAMAEFVMSRMCRFKPFFWGAVCFWTGAILCVFSYCVLKRGDIQFLILAICMIIGFVIPGNLLNKKSKENV